MWLPCGEEAPPRPPPPPLPPLPPSPNLPPPPGAAAAAAAPALVADVNVAAFVVPVAAAAAVDGFPVSGALHSKSLLHPNLKGYLIHIADRGYREERLLIHV